jgi:HlyD family secretion protein
MKGSDYLNGNNGNTKSGSSLIAKLFALIFLIGGVYYFYFNKTASKLDLKNFDFELVGKGDITKTITANGTINPVNVVSVGTQVSGTIEKIFVDYNDIVKKGEKLAKLDTSILEKNVGESESNLKKTKINLDLSELDYKRNKKLFENNYIAKVELDQAETSYKNYFEEYNVAKSKHEIAKINLGYATIISPVSGVVISREIDVGQTVASAFSAPTLFKIAEDLTKMQIETSVSEADIGSIKIGQSVKFTVDSFADIKIFCVVKKIMLKTTNESNVVVYNVIINIRNDDKKLMPGMTAYVSIPIAEVKDVKKINSVALRFRPDSKLLQIMGAEKLERKPDYIVLYKLVGEKVTSFYAKRGLSSLSETEIISDFVNEGDKIISNSTLVFQPSKK